MNATKQCNNERAGYKQIKKRSGTEHPGMHHNKWILRMPSSGNSLPTRAMRSVLFSGGGTMLVGGALPVKSLNHGSRKALAPYTCINK